MLLKPPVLFQEKFAEAVWPKLDLEVKFEELDSSVLDWESVWFGLDWESVWFVLD